VELQTSGKIIQLLQAGQSGIHSGRNPQSGLPKQCRGIPIHRQDWAEAAYFKGTLSSKLLFDLVLRLYKLQMHNSLLLHLMHIAGPWMIAQGKDRLSWGVMSAGALHEGDLLQHVPLHLTAIEWNAKPLEEWVTRWSGDSCQITWLQPKGWFTMSPGMVRTLLQTPGWWSIHHCETNGWRRCHHEWSRGRTALCTGKGGEKISSALQMWLMFRNLMKHNPVVNLAQDIRVQKSIRRANLDALWSWEHGTVYSTLQLGRQEARIAKHLSWVHSHWKTHL